MMHIGAVHHIGYIVKDINKSIKAFESLEYKKATEIIFDDERKTNFCFLEKDGVQVELVEPDSQSDIYPLLKTYKNSIYHVCYSVSDIDEAVEDLKGKGFLLFRKTQKAPAISNNAKVVFLIHSRMGIIELVQEN